MYQSKLKRMEKILFLNMLTFTNTLVATQLMQITVGGVPLQQLHILVFDRDMMKTIHICIYGLQQTPMHHIIDMRRYIEFIRTYQYSVMKIISIV